MRTASFIAAIFAVTLAATSLRAQTYSTSALNPSPMPDSGVIAGSYPPGGAETTYYFATDLKAGELVTQIAFTGRAGPDKQLEFAVVDSAGKRFGGFYVSSSLDANQELPRVIPIDNSGRYVIRVTTKGPETTKFRVELGGNAAVGLKKPANTDTPFSHSFLAPTPLPKDGVIAAKFPPSGNAEITYYYLSAPLKAGQLLTQLSVAGRPNSPKMVDFSVLNATGRSVGGYYVSSDLGANNEASKAIPIDNSGNYVLRIAVKGAENSSFKLEVGGDAVASQQPQTESTMQRVLTRFLANNAVAATTPISPDGLSRSIMRPTPVTSGVIAGNLPGGDGAATFYITVDLKPGALLTQLSVAGRANSGKRLTFDLLNADARVAAGTYVSADLAARNELTKSFPIDSAGRYIVRLTTEGAETGTYCVLMGGTALPDGAAGCPSTTAAAPVAPPAAAVAPNPATAVPAAPAALPTPPAPAAVKVVEVPPRSHNFEVILAKCEERLRVGSDFLFDFDRADVRSEAGPTLDEIAARLTKSGHGIMIEGHTDGKGSDTYNQALSERRAIAVRASLTERGLPLDRLNIRGFGKTRPVAQNQFPDGADDPEGRQKNRRVEVVTNTCG